MTASSPHDIDQLSRRLEGLERKARRWRWACFAILSATLVAVVEGTDWIRTRESLVARQIVLKDEAGRVRARMDADNPGVIIYDENGKEHAKLQSRPDGTSRLSLLESGILRGEMGNRPDGSSRVCVIDDRHRIAAGFHVAPDGSGRVFLGGQPLSLPERRDPTQLAAKIAGGPLQRSPGASPGGDAAAAPPALDPNVHINVKVDGAASAPAKPAPEADPAPMPTPAGMTHRGDRADPSAGKPGPAAPAEEC